MHRRDSFDAGTWTLRPQRKERTDFVDAEKHFSATPDEQQHPKLGHMEDPSATFRTWDTA
jgi:hypothetical protein